MNNIGESAGESIGYQAEWVFPVCGPPLHHAVVEIRDGRIGFVGPKSSFPGDRLVDLNEQLQASAAILPGLVNAHTHLEFSSLSSPIGTPNSPITDWIPQVIRWRRERDETAGSPHYAAKSDAIARGIKLSCDASVARLGEISTAPWTAKPYGEANTSAPSLRLNSFMELIALSKRQNEAAIQTAERHLATEKTNDVSSRVGLSPHAPYTVNIELLGEIIDLSARSQAPLQMHLAESPEEIELMATNQGPFREMLEQADLWQHAELRHSLRPLDYLELLSKASRCIVAHGNYLNSEEISFLSESKSCMSVAFCPRTHAFFGHERHPVKAMLASGVNVALGTDSKASNPDLSLHKEMKFLASRGEAPPDQIVQMATRNGAIALGVEGGILAEGEPADLSIFSSQVADDPYEFILGENCAPARLVIAGQTVASPN